MSEDDVASEQEEFARQTALAAKKPEGPVAIGKCVWCGFTLTGTMRWCDANCRSDWEREERLGKRTQG